MPDSSLDAPRPTQTLAAASPPYMPDSSLDAPRPTHPADYAAVNFIEDVLERYPASKPALVTIAHDGERRIWHFGELIARSAGLSGAFAARGVGRGDVVMTLLGNRIEWVLTLLACWRMGAIALPCNTQLRRKDLQLRTAVADPALCVGDEELLGELPDG